MKTHFIQPRFAGRRFDEHTLPVEIARDLAAYETLVIELAKHLYLKDHPGKTRVPKGFSADFQLHLEKVDGGSAMPLLSLVVAGTTAAINLGLFPAEPTYFDRARDLITNCVADEAALPQAGFPKHLLPHFNHVGRSLRDDESMEFSRGDLSPAQLTPERRKRLVLAAESEYEREVELVGFIEEVDWVKATFRLRLINSATCVVPMAPTFHEMAREIGGHSRHQVSIKAVATYDSKDSLQKVITADAPEVQRNAELCARFDALAELQDGWHDGSGRAPNQNGLLALSEKMVAHYPEKVPLPMVVPTPEGNILLEWNTTTSPSVDINLTTMRAEFHAFGNEDNEVERDFSLLDEAAWAAFFNFLSSQITSN